MLDTKLILIEGLPGSGKSTTTSWLEELLQDSGIPCAAHLEEDRPHPIPCLDFEIMGLTEKMIPLWQEFVQQSARHSTITILEGRLWHTTALFMFMSEVSDREIFEFNHRVGYEIAPLSPTLIYLDQPDVEAALRRMAASRGEAWVQAALMETLDYPWFVSRGIRDFDGWISFFQAWHKVSEQLFSDWPFHKLKVLNPHEDWDNAHKDIASFLRDWSVRIPMDRR